MPRPVVADPIRDRLKTQAAIVHAIVSLTLTAAVVYKLLGYVFEESLDPISAAEALDDVREFKQTALRTLSLSILLQLALFVLAERNEVLNRLMARYYPAIPLIDNPFLDRLLLLKSIPDRNLVMVLEANEYANMLFNHIHFTQPVLENAKEQQHRRQQLLPNKYSYANFRDALFNSVLAKSQVNVAASELENEDDFVMVKRM